MSHHEAKTFSGVIAAREWAKHREIEHCDSLGTTLIDHVRQRRASGTGPATVSNDLNWLRCVLRAAASVKDLPVRADAI